MCEDADMWNHWITELFPKFWRANPVPCTCEASAVVPVSYTPHAQHRELEGRELGLWDGFVGKRCSKRESASESCPLTWTHASWCCTHMSKMNKQMWKRYEGWEVTEEVLTDFLICKSETDGKMTVKITAALQSVAGIRTPWQSQRLFLHACLSHLSVVLFLLHPRVELLTELVL